VLLADSLALMRAMNQLDAAQTIDSLGQIFVRASAMTPTPLSLATAAIRRPNSTSSRTRWMRCAVRYRVPTSLQRRTRPRPRICDISARDGWYNKSHALTTSATFVSLVGKATIVPLSSFTGVARNERKKRLR